MAKVAVYSVRRFERATLEGAFRDAGVEPVFLDAGLDERTAGLAAGCVAACPFVNDACTEPSLRALAAQGVRLLALRSAGFNHVDVAAAERLGLCVARVPAYSPYAVAEHAVALLLAAVRRLHRALPRVRDHNFALDGLMGSDLHGKTVGVVGTGKIGAIFCRIMRGFGCRVLAVDPARDAALAAEGVEYVEPARLWRESDVIALHCPLTPATRHLVDDAALAQMRPGVVLVNTSRGAVVDTRAVIAALKAGRIGALALDVYEEEGDVFFRDLSEEALRDDVLARLLTFPNVLMTAHQAFFTREAVEAIARTTALNVASFAAGGAAGVPPANRVTADMVR